MRVADIEKEYKQISDTQRVIFSTYSVVSPEQWTELESHKYLYIDIGNDIQEEELSYFLTNLLSRRKQVYLEAARIDLNSTYCDPMRNEKLLLCLKAVLSSTSRVYLE